MKIFRRKRSQYTKIGVSDVLNLLTFNQDGMEWNSRIGYQCQTLQIQFKSDCDCLFCSSFSPWITQWQIYRDHLILKQQQILQIILTDPVQMKQPI